MEPIDQYNNIDIDIVDVRDLVLSYLVHNCYKDTLESLVGDPSSSCTRLPLQNTYIDERKSMPLFIIFIFSFILPHLNPRGLLLQKIALLNSYTTERTSMYCPSPVLFIIKKSRLPLPSSFHYLISQVKKRLYKIHAYERKIILFCTLSPFYVPYSWYIR